MFSEMLVMLPSDEGLHIALRFYMCLKIVTRLNVYRTYGTHTDLCSRVLIGLCVSSTTENEHAWVRQRHCFCFATTLRLNYYLPATGTAAPSRVDRHFRDCSDKKHDSYVSHVLFKTIHSAEAMRRRQSTQRKATTCMWLPYMADPIRVVKPEVQSQYMHRGSCTHDILSSGSMMSITALSMSRSSIAATSCPCEVEVVSYSAAASDE